MKKSNIMRKLLSVFLALGVIMTLAGCKKAQDTTTEKPQASPPAPAMSEVPQKSEEVEAVPTVSVPPSSEPSIKHAHGDSKGNLTTDPPTDEEIQSIISDASKNKEEELKIPIYYEDEILYGIYDGVQGGHYSTWPGFNNSNPHFHNSVSNKCYGILTAFPNGAWRDMGGGRKYLMYDTEKGTRMYIFFTSENDYYSAKGYTLYSSKKLSYADMKSLKMGQTIDDVINIDPTAKFVKHNFDRLTDTAVKEKYATNWKQPITTVHLLTDGIMKFTYERSGQEGHYVYTITDIEYHSDFKMKSILPHYSGTATIVEEMDYSIAEVDYVD